MIPAPIPPNGISIYYERKMLRFIDKYCGLVVSGSIFIFCTFLPFTYKDVKKIKHEDSKKINVAE